MNWWSSWGSISKDVLLALLALYGAALSTFNWRQATKKERRQVSVSWDAFSMQYVDGYVEGPLFNTRAYLGVKATNIGQRPVSIVKVGIEMEDGKQVQVVEHFPSKRDSYFPTEIKDGESVAAFTSCICLADGIEKLKPVLALGASDTPIKLFPYAKDSAGGKYLGEATVVTVAELLKEKTR